MKIFAFLLLLGTARAATITVWNQDAISDAWFFALQPLAGGADLSPQQAGSGGMGAVVTFTQPEGAYRLCVRDELEGQFYIAAIDLRDGDVYSFGGWPNPDYAMTGHRTVGLEKVYDARAARLARGVSVEVVQKAFGYGFCFLLIPFAVLAVTRLVRAGVGVES